VTSPKLVEQRPLVGSETLCRASLRVTGLLETLGEQSKVVLSSLELAAQRVTFDDSRLEIGLGTCHVALKGGVAGFELIEAPACPRGPL
jgi:hypothetical protein